MPKAKWRAGQFNNHRLELVPGIQAVVIYSNIDRNKPGYVVRYLGRESTQPFQDLAAAKKYAEDGLQSLLKAALENLT